MKTYAGKNTLIITVKVKMKVKLLKYWYVV